VYLPNIVRGEKIVQVFPHDKALDHRLCQDQAHPRLHLPQVLVWVRPTPWLYVPQTHINGCHIEQNVLGMPLLSGHLSCGAHYIILVEEKPKSMHKMNNKMLKCKTLI
jgi:hypothetical protein